jgi:hypothetical protein
MLMHPPNVTWSFKKTKKISNNKLTTPGRLQAAAQQLTFPLPFQFQEQGSGGEESPSQPGDLHLDFLILIHTY